MSGSPSAMDIQPRMFGSVHILLILTVGATDPPRPYLITFSARQLGRTSRLELPTRSNSREFICYIALTKTAKRMSRFALIHLRNAQMDCLVTGLPSMWIVTTVHTISCRWRYENAVRSTDLCSREIPRLGTRKMVITSNIQLVSTGFPGRILDGKNTGYLYDT